MVDEVGEVDDVVEDAVGESLPALHGEGEFGAAPAGSIADAEADALGDTDEGAHHVLHQAPVQHRPSQPRVRFQCLPAPVSFIEDGGVNRR